MGFKLWRCHDTVSSHRDLSHTHLKIKATTTPQSRVPSLALYLVQPGSRFHLVGVGGVSDASRSSSRSVYGCTCSLATCQKWSDTLLFRIGGRWGVMSGRGKLLPELSRPNFFSSDAATCVWVWGTAACFTDLNSLACSLGGSRSTP